MRIYLILLVNEDQGCAKYYSVKILFQLHYCNTSIFAMVSKRQGTGLGKVESGIGVAILLLLGLCNTIIGCLWGAWAILLILISAAIVLQYYYFPEIVVARAKNAFKTSILCEKRFKVI